MQKKKKNAEEENFQRCLGYDVMFSRVSFTGTIYGLGRSQISIAAQRNSIDSECLYMI